PAVVALMAAGRSGVWMKAGLVAGLLLLGGLGLLAGASQVVPPAPPAKVESPRPANASSRQDLYGDPLPPDGIARMGTIRWRHVDDSGQHMNFIFPSPTGKLVATATFGDAGKGEVRVWELPDGKQLCEFPWDSTVRNLQFTPDGSRLMVLAPRGVVRFHDARTGKLLAESNPIPGPNDEHRITSDGRWLATTNEQTLTLTQSVTHPP